MIAVLFNEPTASLILPRPAVEETGGDSWKYSLRVSKDAATQTHRLTPGHDNIITCHHKQVHVKPFYSCCVTDCQVFTCTVIPREFLTAYPG